MTKNEATFVAAVAGITYYAVKSYFKTRVTEQLKRAEIESLLKAGVLKVSEIAEQVGVSEPTVRSVKAKMEG